MADWTHKIFGGWLLLLVMCSLAQLAAAKDITGIRSEKLINSEDILPALGRGQPTVKVIVNLAEPCEIRRMVNWNSHASLDTLRAEVRTRQEAVLGGLAANELRLRRRFENQTAFSAEVTSEGLSRLSNNPMVESIEPVRLFKLHLAQGIPLMNGLAYRSVYDGEEVAIAVCDTGIDYSHSKLGGGGFPNSKVIGGYDFGDGDSNPIPGSEAHGTCCAGIAAGDLGTVGDYIGGVACGAKLYALKVEDSDGYIYDDYIISAWDWCVTHKNDDPCHPILVISNSFGGERYYSVASAESSSPSLAAAASSAVAAGITVLASSGNEGYCDSLAAPAAFSSVISVGAVYDASLGDVGFCSDTGSCIGQSDLSCLSEWACFDNPSAADMVTCYSNTAAFLSVLAPSNDAYTTDIVGSDGYSSGDYFSEFGGTSAACPYTAGAVACLQSAAKNLRGGYMTPLEVKSILTSTGDNITDSKAGVTKPRVNLGNAMDSLYTSPGNVGIMGSWVTGTTHTKESGSNRALIFIVHAERSGSLIINSVSYGGQPMTKIIDTNSISGYYREGVAAYRLGEAGVAAATSGDFNVNWGDAPSSVSYSSVFLSDVNQAAIIGDSAGNSGTSGTLTTSALSTRSGDMVIDAATCGNTGRYTVNNNFIRAIEHSMSSADGVDGYKSATGAAETPSVTHDNINRQVLIGFVVRALGVAPPVAISGRVLEISSHTPVAGVLMQTDDNDINAVTDVNGFYEVLVDSGWSGTVTPSKKHYTFTPSQMSYVNVLAGQPEQNYMARNIYDLDGDGFIDIGDVLVFANNWLATGVGIPGDFDADGDVDFIDFAELGIVWDDR